MQKMIYVLLCAVILITLCVCGETNVILLPKPQNIEYGKDFFVLQNTVVRITNNDKSKEDVFTAEYLIKTLNSKHHSDIKLVNTGKKRTISLTRTKPDIPLALPGEKAGENSRESYSLKVTSDKIELSSPSSAGLFFGVQTLIQLADDGKIPQVEIHDWPSLAYRGVMVDMSHGPLLKVEEVKNQIDFLSKWKVNQYYLYSECSIELDGYPLVMRGGKFSKAQIREIIEYGSKRHIDVIPNLDLFGHMHDLLKIEKYSDLGYFPHGPELNPIDNRVKELLKNWIKQFSDLFPSPFVHIGFDETWQMELASKEETINKSPDQLFIEQLEFVTKEFENKGKTVMAWGDVTIEYPEIIKKLSPKLIHVAWDYGEQPQSEKWIKPFTDHNLKFFIQPGVANWMETSVDSTLTFANIDNFLADGRKAGTIGIIISFWADTAQSLTRMSWHTLAYGGCASWQSQPMNREQFFDEYSSIYYSKDSSNFVSVGMDKLDKAENALQEFCGQTTLLTLWWNPYELNMYNLAQKHKASIIKARILSEEAEEAFLKALENGADKNTIDTLIFGAKMVNYCGFKYLNAIDIEDKYIKLGAKPDGGKLWREFNSEISCQAHSRAADMQDAILQLRDEYSELWDREFTKYRKASSIGRFDAEYEYWRKLQYKFYEFSFNHDETKPLPPFRSFVDGN